MKILTPLVILLYISFSPGTVYAQDIVARMVGVWVGEGAVRPRGFDAPEKIRCKVVGEKLSDVEVKFAGRCATTSGAGEFRLFVAQDVTGALFAARIRFSNAGTALDFKGVLTGDQILLEQDEAVQQGVRLVQSTISLILPKRANIELINEVRDLNTGEKVQSLKIEFVRQN